MDFWLVGRILECVAKWQCIISRFQICTDIVQQFALVDMGTVYTGRARACYVVAHSCVVVGGLIQHCMTLHFVGKPTPFASRLQLMSGRLWAVNWVICMEN